MSKYDEWHQAFNDLLDEMEGIGVVAEELRATLTELDEVWANIYGFDRGVTGSEAIKYALKIVQFDSMFTEGGVYFYPTKNGICVFNEREFIRSARASALGASRG